MILANKQLLKELTEKGNQLQKDNPIDDLFQKLQQNKLIQKQKIKIHCLIEIMDKIFAEKHVNLKSYHLDQNSLKLVDAFVNKKFFKNLLTSENWDDIDSLQDKIN